MLRNLVLYAQCSVNVSCQDFQKWLAIFASSNWDAAGKLVFPENVPLLSENKFFLSKVVQVGCRNEAAKEMDACYQVTTPRWLTGLSVEPCAQLSTLEIATAVSLPRLWPKCPPLLAWLLHEPLQCFARYHPNPPPHIHLLILPYKAYNTLLSADEPAGKVVKQMASLTHEKKFYF